ncbi:MAG: aminotransferase class I/II-fold pyridoxal phosphate-dependent enzyme [Trueperaceae bacterium]|nr:aminotransferase class I/II-fold pyridoxal phosphate-dependent enzyme [Trueperaceae bacterium]
MSPGRFASARARAMPASVFATMDDAKSDARRRGLEVVDLSIGSSDLPPPQGALARVREAADDPDTYGYCLQAGTRPLREAACDWYQGRYGWRPDPDREALPLIGAQEGFANLLLATCDAGDTVLLPEPAYPSYFGAVALAGLDVVTMPLLAQNAFLPDLDQVPNEAAARARVMVACYPNNPTAGTATPAFFEEAVAFCAHHDLLLVHDFPYVDLDFSQAGAPSAFDAPNGRDRVVELYSFSKSFHMAGFRIGFALGAVDAIAALARVKGAIDFHAWLGIQRAAVAALRTPRSRVQAHADIYRERRDALVDELNRAGMPTQRPDATMYVWTRLPGDQVDSYAFAARLVRQTGVAVAPGRAFGPSGEGWIRLALVREPGVLRAAARQVATHLD